MRRSRSRPTHVHRRPDWVEQRARELIAAGFCADHYQRLLDHDPTCTTLHNVWLPSPGGTSGCDIEWCAGCELIFADATGMVFIELACGTEVLLCECCTR